MKTRKARLELMYLGMGGVYEDDKFVTVEYGGNMGSTLTHSVIPRFEERYGLGTFARLRAVAIKETGSPDYDWKMVIKKKDFRDITNTNPLF